MFTGLPLYLIIGLAATTLIGGGISSCQYQRAERYQAEKTALEDEAMRLSQAIASKDDVIGKLQSGLKDWENWSKRDADAADEAAQKAADLEQQVQNLGYTINRLREKDNALPDCVSLLKTDLALVCPSTASGLRQLSGYHLQGQTDSSAHASPEEAGQPAH